MIVENHENSAEFKAVEQKYADLYKKGAVVMIECTGTTFKCGNHAADFGLAEENIPDGMYLGNQLWIPKDVVNERDKIYGRVRAALERNSHKMGGRNIRFVQFTRLAEINAAVEEGRTDLEKWKEDYIRNEQKNIDTVENALRHTHQNHPTLLQAHLTKVRNARLTASGVLDGCAIRMSMHCMTLPSETTQLEAFEAAFLADAQGAANTRAAEEARVIVKRMVADSAREIEQFEIRAKEDMQIAFLRDFQAIQDRVEAGSDLTMKSVNSLKKAIARFRNLDMFGLKDIGQVLNEVEAKLEVENIKHDKGAQKSVQEALSQAISEVTNSLEGHRRRFGL